MWWDKPRQNLPPLRNLICSIFESTTYREAQKVLSNPLRKTDIQNMLLNLKNVQLSLYFAKIEQKFANPSDPGIMGDKNMPGLKL